MTFQLNISTEESDSNNFILIDWGFLSSSAQLNDVLQNKTAAIQTFVYTLGRLCAVCVVSRSLCVVDEFQLASCRVWRAHYPVVFILFSFMGIQEGVSCYFILFPVCGPAGTQMFEQS